MAGLAMNEIERAKAMLAGSTVLVPTFDNPNDVREYRPMPREEIDALRKGDPVAYVYQNKAYHMTFSAWENVPDCPAMLCDYGRHGAQFRCQQEWLDRVMVEL